MKKNLLISLLISLSLFFAAGCERDVSKDFAKPTKRVYSFVSPTFSPDNNKIIFGCCAEDGCSLATYEIPTKKLTAFNPTSNRYHGNPVYSQDGQKIVFNAGPDYKISQVSNIYTMNADGTDVRQITHDDNKNPRKDGENTIVKYNVVPSFSPDGKRVLFKRAGVIRKHSIGYGTMPSDWDVYEVNLDTGIEKRLTDYTFYKMSRPYYLSDGRRFIFSGEGPQNDTGVGPKDFREYEEKYGGNKIFIMDGKNNVLRPAFQYGRHSSQPAVAKDNAVLFLSITNEMDGLPRNPYNYDLFLKKGEKITRVTKLQAHITGQHAISLDGSKVVFVAIMDKDRKRGGTTLWMANTDGTGLQKIDLPWEKLEIIPKSR